MLFYLKSSLKYIRKKKNSSNNNRVWSWWNEVNEDYLIKILKRKPVREWKFLALKNSIDIPQALEKSDIINSLMSNQTFKIDFSNKMGKTIA